MSLYGIDDFRNGDIEFGEKFRPYPEAHGILAGTKNRDTGNAWDSSHLVVNVDERNSSPKKWNRMSHWGEKSENMISGEEVAF